MKIVMDLADRLKMIRRCLVMASNSIEDKDIGHIADAINQVNYILEEDVIRKCDSCGLRYNSNQISCPLCVSGNTKNVEGKG